MYWPLLRARSSSRPCSPATSMRGRFDITLPVAIVATVALGSSTGRDRKCLVRRMPRGGGLVAEPAIGGDSLDKLLKARISF